MNYMYTKAVHSRPGGMCSDTVQSPGQTILAYSSKKTPGRPQITTEISYDVTTNPLRPPRCHHISLRYQISSPKGETTA